MRCACFYMAVLIGLVIGTPISQAAPTDPPGWEWYNVPVSASVPVTKKTNPSQPDAVTQMKALRAMVNEAMDEAILSPSPEHATTYLMLNNLLTQNAKNFTVSVQQALLLHPELNFMIGHPTQTAARQVQLQQLQQQTSTKIRALAKTDGFLFFYRGKNTMDQLASKTLAGFAKTYGISVMGVSVDGTLDPVLAMSKRDHGQARTLGVKAYPALFLVDPQAKTAQPVFYGVLSQSEMVTRLYNVATNFKRERSS